MSSDVDYTALLHRIEAQIDLKHACGYVTVLRTGVRYDWPQPIEDHQQDSAVACEQSEFVNHSTVSSETSDFVLTEGSSVVGNDSVSGSGAKNGVKDNVSAEILASEVDSLNEEVAGPESFGVASSGSAVQGIGETAATRKNNKSRSSGNSSSHDVQQQQTSSEWLLLDCHFGIPLFDIGLNHDVLERLQNNGLFTAER